MTHKEFAQVYPTYDVWWSEFCRLWADVWDGEPSDVDTKKNKELHRSFYDDRYRPDQAVRKECGYDGN